MFAWRVRNSVGVADSTSPVFIFYNGGPLFIMLSHIWPRKKCANSVLTSQQDPLWNRTKRPPKLKRNTGLASPSSWVRFNKLPWLFPHIKRPPNCRHHLKFWTLQRNWERKMKNRPKMSELMRPQGSQMEPRIGGLCHRGGLLSVFTFSSNLHGYELVSCLVHCACTHTLFVCDKNKRKRRTQIWDRLWNLLAMVYVSNNVEPRRREEQVGNSRGQGFVSGTLDPCVPSGLLNSYTCTKHAVKDKAVVGEWRQTCEISIAPNDSETVRDTNIWSEMNLGCVQRQGD